MHAPLNPDAVKLLPNDLKLAVPGKFTVAVAVLNSPPLTLFSDDNKTLQGSEVDIAGLRMIVGSGTNQEAILLAWDAENQKKGLKSFTPEYVKDDAAQTLALQSGRANAFLART